MCIRDSLEVAGVRGNVLGAIKWDQMDEDPPDPQSQVLGFAFGVTQHANVDWLRLRHRVFGVGIVCLNDKMLYLPVSKHGTLTDAAVAFYNQHTTMALATKVRLFSEAECARESVLHWPLFHSTPAMGSVQISRDPEDLQRYVAALTRFAIHRKRCPPEDSRRHRIGCICNWIPDVKEQWKCQWCPTKKDCNSIFLL